jgi:anti-sigma regulatory factor (Ser/Thr protein kinase)
VATLRHDHAVNLYDDEVDLITAVALHVLDGSLTLGQRMIVVATPEHRAAIDEALTSRGADPDELRRAGEYLTLDAAETLRCFMVDGSPDPALFQRTVTEAIRSVSGDGRPPRIYGEMVAVLWDEGNVTAALALESLWNDLASQHEFSLLCGYPMSALERHADLEAIRDVCRLHTGLVPPRRYRGPGHADLPAVDVLERAEVFLRVPEAVGGVRKWLRATLSAWEEHDVIDDANVVASELATNAIRHAESPFRVTATRITTENGRMIRLSFDDLSDGRPALNDAEHEQLGGRGVHLVAQLASRWGVDSTAGGKTVWAEFRARERRQAPRAS